MHNVVVVALFAILPLLAQAQTAGSASDIPTAALINPSDVATLVQSKAQKLLILQVGSHVLFQQAHIPSSEYIGAASTAEGREQLRKRIRSVPKSQSIILYCGCCPWEHCPNVKPAYKELHDLRFSNVKVMYIANNFGKDWVEKGYPTTKGD